MKQKNFGFRGSITPYPPIKDLDEEWEQEDISFSVKNGVFEATFFDEKDREKARQIAYSFIEAWSFTNDKKLTVDFNHFWGLKGDGNTARGLNLSDGVEVADRVITTRTRTLGLKYEVAASITPFLANQLLVEKSFKDETLRKVLCAYYREVVGEERWQYGVYKVLEPLIDKLGNGVKKGQKRRAWRHWENWLVKTGNM